VHRYRLHHFTVVIHPRPYLLPRSQWPPLLLSLVSGHSRLRLPSLCRSLRLLIHLVWPRQLRQHRQRRQHRQPGGPPIHS